MDAASRRGSTADAAPAKRNWQTSLRQRQTLRENQIPAGLLRIQGLCFSARSRQSRPKTKTLPLIY